uniref:Phosphatidic acid phosphatase type 2/haloperoxidase domain-containing protein n=1 Tax=Euplotes crassus TaxID=5936 RepID=A0A7S3NWS2_EUPCR|mmetsp:Transcript_25398/g.25136  ORF Transcript_25398/g.25136 Transcript_25398/m.25136 type:complete len:119 (+) Transcript_25398:320-676(+)
MPSGHSSFSVCFIIWSAYAYYMNLKKAWLPIFFLIAGIIVIISRVYLGYHTLLQVSMGSTVGLFLSTTYFYMIHYKTKLMKRSREIHLEEGISLVKESEIDNYHLLSNEEGHEMKKFL